MGILHYFLSSIILVAQIYWDNELNTAKNSEYMSAVEKAVVFELNKVRNNPASYAKENLEILRNYYDGNKLTYPRENPIITLEGRRALEECIDFLEDAPRAKLLYPRKGLYLAAADHVKDQSQNGGIGHFGNDNSRPVDRIEKYGVWDICTAENISYGSKDARKIVVSLLIDDGVPDRGHRKNILDTRFSLTGVSCGSHPDYGFMCVIEFAGAYENK